MKRAITILFILCLNSFAQLKSVSSVHLKAGENFALLEIEVNAPNVELTKNSTNSTIVLYDVSIPHGDSTRILGLISTKNKELDTSKLKWRFSSAENRYLVQQLDKTTQATKILKSSPDYDRLQKEWKKAFQKQLEK